MLAFQSITAGNGIKVVRTLRGRPVAAPYSFPNLRRMLHQSSDMALSATKGPAPHTGGICFRTPTTWSRIHPGYRLQLDHRRKWWRNLKCKGKYHNRYHAWLQAGLPKPPFMAGKSIFQEASGIADIRRKREACFSHQDSNAG